MFIRLTRLDNTPIWINASFVVTVEPRKAGGSIVVPIGDGLDYDVKETPEAVLAMLDGAPAPAVVPVSAPPGLAPKTLGVVEPEAAPSPAAAPTQAPMTEPAPAPVKKTSRARAKSKASAAPAAETEATTAEPAADDKPPAKKPRARRTKKPELTLTEDEVARLRKMAPGTVRKLQNTLVAQFRTVEPEAAIAALEAHEILSLDRDHVTWK